MSRPVMLGLLFATLLALGLRCPDLSVRPMHNDEAVNAIKLRPLLEQGTYRYDPQEHHGPTLSYFALAWTRVTGGGNFTTLSEARLRGLTVLFGVGLILLLPLVLDGLGRGATVCSALLIAISPAMVFYSRYFIHEMLLVFFTFLALAAFWRFYRDGKIRWAVIAGAAVGLMQSTKETFVLSLAAAGVALLVNKLWTRSGDVPAAGTRKPGKPVAAAVLAWFVVAVVFLSSFFSNADGPLDSIRTYLPWAGRAAGNSPHLHPWDFYLTRLAFFHTHGGSVWSEGLILGLAGVGMVAAFTRRGVVEGKGNFLRFVALYTLTLAAIYSGIAYKTPWCLLSFWHGAILLAGVGAVAVWRLVRGRWAKRVAVAVLFAGAGQLAFQAWQLSGSLSADRRNPYVYAQTSPDVLELVGVVQALARTSQQGRHTPVQVIAPAGDYWPLPWYLRSLDQVGWWSELPDEPPAPVMIVATSSAVRLDETGSGLVMVGTFQLRPGTFLALYVQPDLWQAYLAARAKPGF